MNPGFPQRNKVISRGYSPIWGGDGRYLYIPNRLDRTISVIDTATDTVISTISLTTWMTTNFDGTWYRSAAKQIIAVRGGNPQVVVVIDADPDSASFNTVIDNYTVTGTYSFNQSAIYDCHNDRITSMTGPFGIDFKSRTTLVRLNTPPNQSYSIAINETYLAYTNELGFSGFIGIDTNRPSVVFKDGSISAYTGIYFKINGFVYVQRSGLHKFRILPRDTNEVEWVSVISTAASPLCYDSFNNKLFCTGGTGGEGLVIDLGGFTNAGTVQARTRAVNEANNAFRAIYSEYSKKVYVYPFNNFTATAGCDRVHVYDLSLPLASCYLGFITTGNNCVATNTAILTNPAAKNRLYTTDFL